MTKEVERIKKQIRIIADAITILHRKGELNSFILKDLDNIVLEEDLEWVME